ncbi:hypothetical protein [Streptomyces sp. NPDC001927]
MTKFDEHLPPLHDAPVDDLEAHFWGLLDGPSGPPVAVGSSQLRAAILGLRIVAAGDGTCGEACLQLANTFNRLLPKAPVEDSPWFSATLLVPETYQP